MSHCCHVHNSARTKITLQTPRLPNCRNKTLYIYIQLANWKQGQILGSVSLAGLAVLDPMCFGQRFVFARLQHAACLPTPDPYAELWINLWSQGGREREGETEGKKR